MGELGTTFRDELPVTGGWELEARGLLGTGRTLPSPDCVSAKQEISIAAQLQILELTAKGRPTNLDLRQRFTLLVPDLQAATANLIPRLRICYARGGLLPHRGTPPFLCGPAILLALLLSILFAFPAGGQAPPDEEVKPIPLLTGSTGFISTFDGGNHTSTPLSRLLFWSRPEAAGPSTRGRHSRRTWCNSRGEA